MAQGTRIKDITTTATSAASDDFLVVDGATNGTRKIAKGNLASAEISAAVLAHDESATAHGLATRYFADKFHAASTLCSAYQGFDSAIGDTHYLVPTGTGNLHADFGFKGTLRTLSQIAISRPFVFVPHTDGAVTKAAVGTNMAWGTVTEATARGGGYSRLFVSSGTVFARGSTIAFAFTGTSVGIWYYASTNGGIGIVSVDGSATAASALPAISAAMVAANTNLTSDDIGKRFIDFDKNTIVADVWVLIADGLSSGAHTVSIEAVGNPSTADARLYCSGFGYSAADTTFLTSGAAPAAVKMVLGFDSINRASTPSEVLPVVSLASKGDFVGGIHGGETQVSFVATLKDGTVYHDASGSLPTAGGVTQSETFSIRRVSTINNGSVDVATRTIDILFSNALAGGCVIEDKWVWLVGANGDAATRTYVGMLPTYSVGADNATQAVFPEIETPAGNVEITGGGALSYAFGSWGYFSNGDYDAYIRMIPDSPLYAFVHDRATNLGAKYYIGARPFDTRKGIATGDIWQSSCLLGVCAALS